MNYEQWVEGRESELMEMFSDKYPDLFIEYIWNDKKLLYDFFEFHKEKFNDYCNHQYDIQEGEAA